MAINKDSNGYTFGFAIAMVVIVGVALASISMGLKPLQEKNAKDKKMISILGAIKVEANRQNAKEMFDQYVTGQIVIDHEGNEIDGQAFDIDVQAQYKDKSLSDSAKKYPLFVCEKEGESFYVIPLVGTGLWGPIWGFMALEDDYNTVYGATFDHKGETPGLGAEIKTVAFQDQFPGKKINAEDGSLASIAVVKGGAEEGNLHQVDGITGGTITSDGVSKMLENTLKVYHAYFKKK